MDAQALENLHTALQAKGYAGTADEVSHLVATAHSDSAMRHTLWWWKNTGGEVHHDALTKAYAHARNRGRSVQTLGAPDRVTLTLSRPRGPARSWLGRVDVDGKEIVWTFYTGTEVARQRSKPVLAKPL